MCAAPVDLGKTWLYHITHIRNLPSIISQGGLFCCTRLEEKGLKPQNIAYSDIQDRRRKTVVPCSVGGSLHNYVPFSFASRSPMLYTLNQGNVPDFSDPQSSIIYLVTTVQAIIDSSLPYAFTDGHAIMRLSSFYDQVTGLDNIDWDVMASRYWNDTTDAPDRKRKRMAEFLIYDFCPWSSILGVVVMDKDIALSVKNILGNDQTGVAIRPQWYY